MHTIKHFIALITLMLIYFNPLTSSASYDVHWLQGASTIERDATKQIFDIYCYTGTPKTLFSMFQTARFNIRVKGDDFSEYVGGSPGEVYSQYSTDGGMWSAMVGGVLRRPRRTITLDPHNATCLALHTDHPHTIELQIIRVDVWRVWLVLAGAMLACGAGQVARAPAFHLVAGAALGVAASALLLVWLAARLLPRRALTYGALAGGTAVSVWLLRVAWDNARLLLHTHQAAVVWYTCASAALGALAAYRLGPPSDPRTTNIVMWTLQGVGALCVYYGCAHREAAAALVAAALAVAYTPARWLRAPAAWWRRRFPPRARLLSDEEYFAQGARETKRALDELRTYCASPDCKQWDIMLKLNDSKRFASFVEGDSHLSDDEILDYEAYAFSLDGARHKRSPRTPQSPRSPRVRVTRTVSRADISDDEEDISEDDDLPTNNLSSFKGDRPASRTAQRPSLQRAEGGIQTGGRFR